MSLILSRFTLLGRPFLGISEVSPRVLSAAETSRTVEEGTPSRSATFQLLRPSLSSFSMMDHCTKTFIARIHADV